MSHPFTVRTPVTFNAATSSRRVEGGYAVYPDALLFAVGDYSDKSFSLDHAEMDRAIATFTPFAGNVDHTPFLRGRAFHVESVHRDAKDPGKLRGTVRVPLALDELLTDAEKGLSAEWDRTTKRLIGAALTPNPRIKGASLVASFAAKALEHAEDPDLMREAVAVMAEFCACQSTPTREERPMPTRREEDIARLQEMSDDEYDAIDDEPDDVEDDDVDEGTYDEPAAGGSSNFSAEAASLRAEVEALKAERRLERAAAFAADMKQQGRISPFEEATTASVMFSAMSDDDLVGDVVHFAVGDKPARGTREEMVRSAYGQRLPHPHAGGRDAIAGRAQFSHVLSNGGDKPETDEEYAARVNKKHYRVGSNGSA